MKIYVDELPKSCSECPFIHSELSEWDLEYKDYCTCIKMWVTKYTKNRIKDCPLQLLADHDKQVRNEVCDNLVEMLTDRAELIDCGGCAEFMFTTYDLQESVKEIQGENYGRNTKTD